MDPIAATALYTAMLRAMESAGPDPLFTDPFAAELAGAQGREVLDWMEARAPGASQNQAIAVRTRFFDDALQRILAESEVNQLVELGADFGRWPAPDHDDPDYPHGYLIVAQR